MIYIAKMGTNYPDYHGEGYYNFLMEGSKEELSAAISRNNHDFHLIAQKKTRFESVENVLAKYSTKARLNKALFS